MAIPRCLNCDSPCLETEIAEGWCPVCGISLTEDFPDDQRASSTSATTSFSQRAFWIGVLTGVAISLIGVGVAWYCLFARGRDIEQSAGYQLILKQKSEAEGLARKAGKKAKTALAMLAAANTRVASAEKRAESAKEELFAAEKQLHQVKEQKPAEPKQKAIAKNTEKKPPTPLQPVKEQVAAVKKKVALIVRDLEAEAEIKKLREQLAKSHQHYQTNMRMLTTRAQAIGTKYDNLHRALEAAEKTKGQQDGLKSFVEQALKTHSAYNAAEGKKGKREFEKTPIVKNAKRQWQQHRQRHSNKANSVKRQLSQERIQRNRLAAELKTAAAQQEKLVADLLQKLSARKLPDFEKLPAALRSNPNFLAKQKELSELAKRKQQLKKSLRDKSGAFSQKGSLFRSGIDDIEKKQSSASKIAKQIGRQTGLVEGATKFQDAWLRAFDQLDAEVARFARDGNRKQNRIGYRQYIANKVVTPTNESIAKLRQQQALSRAEFNSQIAKLRLITNDVNQTVTQMEQSIRELVELDQRIISVHNELVETTGP